MSLLDQLKAATVEDRPVTGATDVPGEVVDAFEALLKNVPADGTKRIAPLSAPNPSTAGNTAYRVRKALVARGIYVRSWVRKPDGTAVTKGYKGPVIWSLIRIAAEDFTTKSASASVEDPAVTVEDPPQEDPAEDGPDVTGPATD